MTSKKSQLTTLCHIEKDGKYLMLHRVKKKNDVNKDKWIGIGGHFEEGESPEECLVREVREETGLLLERYEFRGIVTFDFINPEDQSRMTEYMCLYTADSFSGQLLPCEEGELQWIEKEKVFELPIWEGDKIFLKLLKANAPFFSLKLCYFGDTLTQAVLDGKEIGTEVT